MSNLTIQDKINLIKNGIFYEEFATDEEFEVRYFTVKAGKYLNILVNDYNYYIRIEVAEKGYGLDKLINDENVFVREAVTFFLLVSISVPVSSTRIENTS